MVTYEGNRLTAGDIVFFPDDGTKIAGADLPQSKIAPDGGYQLATAGRPGAPPGKYRVVVVAQTNERPPDTPANPLDIYSLVPMRYSVFDSTPLRKVVAADPGDYDLKLKREE